MRKTPLECRISQRVGNVTGFVARRDAMTVRKTVELPDPPEGMEWYEDTQRPDGPELAIREWRQRPIKAPTIAACRAALAK